MSPLPRHWPNSRWQKLLEFAMRAARGAEELARQGEDPRPRLDEALGYVSRAVKANAEELEPRAIRAVLYARRGEIEEARGGDGRPWYLRSLADSAAVRDELTTVST